MVRRWSYLTEINFTLNSTFNFKKSFRILLFRRSVHFKRYIRKVTITKLKRKPLIKLKHKTNWMPYFYVIRMWCRDFLFARQLIRFEYINKFYINSFFFYNFNKGHVSNNFIANNFNFVCASITHKLYSYLNLKASHYFHGNQVTIAFCDETPIFDKTAIPVLYDWSNQLIPFNSELALNYDLKLYFEYLYEFFIIRLIELNKYLIILFLFNINKFKNVK